jgi:hypothetical protein
MVLSSTRRVVQVLSLIALLFSVIITIALHGRIFPTQEQLVLNYEELNHSMLQLDQRGPPPKEDQVLPLPAPIPSSPQQRQPQPQRQGQGQQRQQRQRQRAELKLLPEPLQVFRQYQEWHSEESVRQQPENRTFALAYYSCPLQAGNRLHHYFNNLLWAIVTNRTVLWKYYDRATCLGSQSMYAGGGGGGGGTAKATIAMTDLDLICEAANTVQDCDEVLLRASWIPSYDEWASRLELSDPLTLNFWSTRPPPSPQRQRQRRRPPPNTNKDGSPLSHASSYANFTGVDGRTDWSVVSFPVMFGMSGSLNSEERRQILLRNDWARDIARKLHSLGLPFLYGMLFRESFSMTEQTLQGLPVTVPSVPQNQTATTRPSEYDDVSIALHSRHSDTQNDGSDVSGEIRCLEQLLKSTSWTTTTNTHNTTACRVYLMSDRPLTLQNLQQWLQHRNCSVVTTPHKQAGTSFLKEHGPWSGRGFFQDLAVVSQARQGLIAKFSTTSSKLLLELMEYDRTMEAWERGDEKRTELLQRCNL